jgi:hypothetical protein
MKKMSKKELLKLLASCTYMARALKSTEYGQEMSPIWFHSIAMLFCVTTTEWHINTVDMKKVQKSIIDLYNELNEEYIKL